VQSAPVRKSRQTPPPAVPEHDAPPSQPEQAADASAGGPDTRTPDGDGAAPSAEPTVPNEADAAPEEHLAAEDQPPDDAALPAEMPGEPQTVEDAPPLVPPIDQEPLPESGQADVDAELDAEDIESFAARRARLHAKRQKKRRSSRWTAIVLLLFGINVALIGARSEIVRFLPQTASLFSAIGLEVNLRNLDFKDVKISKEAHDGVSVLVVEGTIVNTAGKPVEVPRMRFAVRNTTGQEIYTWTAIPVRSILGPGESQNFRSRLASPPADANDVLVRFYNERDALPGVK